MDRLKCLESTSGINSSSSSQLYQLDDEKNDSSLYYSANEDTLIVATVDLETVNQPNNESPDTQHDDILNLKTIYASAIESSTPKAIRSPIDSRIAVPSAQVSIFNLQFESNSTRLPLSGGASESIASPDSIDTIELETPVSIIASSSADSVVASIAQQTEANTLYPVVEHQNNINHKFVDIATSPITVLHQPILFDRRVLFNDNPMVHEDSSTSSSLAEGRSTGAIPKTENRQFSLNGNSHSNSVLSSRIATPRYRKTPRRPSGKFVLTKLPSMYVAKTSSIPSLNKRVTLNVNMLMPSANSGMVKRRKSIRKKPSKKTSVSAGPSGTNNFMNSAIVNVCEICKKSFDLKKTLIVHRSKHFENPSNICKYCDHKFQKSIALLAHLKEHCLKIPSFERRKLLITELS